MAAALATDRISASLRNESIRARPGLVRVWDPAKSAQEPALALWQAHRLAELESTFTGVAAYTTKKVSLQPVDGAAWRVPAVQVSRDFFALIPFEFVAGNASRMSEPAASGGPTPVVVSVVLSERLSLDVGDMPSIDGQPALVVAVARERSWFPTPEQQLWFPLSAEEVRGSTEADRRVSTPLVHAVAELRRDVSVTQAREFLARSENRFLVGIELESYEQLLRRSVLPPLSVVQTVVFLLLGVGCLNVIAMYALKTEELVPTLRLMVTLGASSRNMVTVLAIDAVTIGLIAWPLALAIAWSVLATLITADVRQAFFFDGASLTASVFAAAGVACLAGSIVASLPNGLRVINALSRGRSTGRLPRRRAALPPMGLLGQVTLVTALSVLTIVQARSLSYLQEPGFIGFDSRGLHAAQVSRRATAGAATVSSQHLAVVQRLAEAEATLGAVSALPLSGYDRSMSLRLRADVGSFRQVGLRLATSSYFSLTRMRFRRGRSYHDSPNPGRGSVVVNTVLASAVFGDSNVVGRRLILGGVDDPELEIVGVVEPSRHGGLFKEPRPEAFVPFSHVVALPPDVRDRFLDTVFFVSRTSDLVGSRRRFERMVAGELPGSELVFLRPVSEVVGEATGERPMLASAAGLFSIISLAMVAFGLYAVVGRSLVKQYRELAVRFALGASAQRAAYATVRPIAFASIGGLALGAILGLAIVRMLAKVLVAPPGFDLGTAIAVAITLSVGSVTAAMLVSCAGPAIRATRRDLASDLRSN